MQAFKVVPVPLFDTLQRALMDTLLYILAGAGVGFAVGLTGIGGGSLMTPLLILFGFPPHVAVGTDLIYASVTKAGGVVFHHRQNTINWPLVLLMLAGSIPASLITVAALSYLFPDASAYQHLITSSLGIMLIMTGLVLLLKGWLNSRRDQYRNLGIPQSEPPSPRKAVLTLIMGIVLGICVTLSSVGAGAFGAAILMILFPYLATIRIIGTDLAHAVPLTLVGGLGHLFLGNVDLSLLASLLVGSLPAIYLGSLLGRHLPDRLMQSILATLLLGIGTKDACT